MQQVVKRRTSPRTDICFKMLCFKYVFDLNTPGYSLDTISHRVLARIGPEDNSFRTMAVGSPFTGAVLAILSHRKERQATTQSERVR
jgi:hypothetical protein